VFITGNLAVKVAKNGLHRGTWLERSSVSEGIVTVRRDHDRRGHLLEVLSASASIPESA
jgi:hypothetical protein